MQARSALFDLYGDYLRPRGGRAPVAALVSLLHPLGISGPAVRTAVSRMVRQAWLRPVRVPGGAGYALTGRAERRLDETAARIYRTGAADWDGFFDVIVVYPPVPRLLRRRLADQLTFLGYGSLGELAWVAARPGVGVGQVLAESGLRHERLRAVHAAGTTGNASLVDGAWDLAEISAAYDRFIDDLSPIVSSVTTDSPDIDAYAARFHLVHAWRSFLFRDPALPTALLPPGWAGAKAAAFFDGHASRLRGAADRYVEQCLLTAEGLAT